MEAFSIACSAPERLEGREEGGEERGGEKKGGG